MSVYLKNQDEMRKVDWGRDYLWAMYFPKAPAPFSTWFPAVDVEESLFNVESKVIEGANTSFKIPLRRGAMSPLKVSYLDDSDHTLTKFFVAWVRDHIFKDIRDDDTSVNWLSNVVRPVHISKFRGDFSHVHETIYLVYPEGELTFHGTQESASSPHVIDFVVAGIQRQERPTAAALSALQTSSGILSSFLS